MEAELKHNSHGIQGGLPINSPSVVCRMWKGESEPRIFVLIPATRTN